MYSKFVTAFIILTVAALCAAAAFQYLEMESFGLPKTLQERFFPEQQPAPVASSEESSGTENQDSAESGNNAENSNSQNAPAAQE